MPPTDSRALEARIYDAVEHHYNSTFSYDVRVPNGYMLALEQHRQNGIEKVRIALSAAPQSDGWRPIAEAPKDGTSVLVNDTTAENMYCMAHYLSGEEWSGWVYDDDQASDGNPLGPQPTHFMHIGPIPTIQTEGLNHGE